MYVCCAYGTVKRGMLHALEEWFPGKPLSAPQECLWSFRLFKDTVLL